MRKRLLTALAVFFGISLVLLLTRSNPVNSFLQQVTQKLFNAPKESLYALGVKNSPANELDALRAQNQKLTAQLVEMERLKRDNQALRDQFEEEAIDTGQLLAANIVGFQGSIQNPEVLVVDTNADARVIEGHAVVVGNNLIGVVEQIAGRFASVRLITHGSFSTVAKSSQSDALGVVKGSNEYMIMERVAITDTIEKDHIIVSRGDLDTSGRGIIPDLVIGRVSAVNKVQSEPFQSARVESLVDIAHLTRVFIYIP